jgi:hypothetical protein
MGGSTFGRHPGRPKADPGSQEGAERDFTRSRLYALRAPAGMTAITGRLESHAAHGVDSRLEMSGKAHGREALRKGGPRRMTARYFMVPQ